MEYLDEFEKFRKIYSEGGRVELIFDSAVFEYWEYPITKREALRQMTRNIIWHDRSLDNE